VRPTPGSGIDTAHTTIIATPDFDDGSGFYHSVMVRGGGSDQTPACLGGFALITSNFDDNTNNYDAVDVAVTFVIP
jgi:hypothetical protein